MSNLTKIKRIRLEKNLLVKDIARVIGISHSVISRVELRRVPASERVADALSRYYGVSRGALFNAFGIAR